MGKVYAERLLMKGDLTLCPWNLSSHCCKHCVAKLLLSLYCFSIASASLSEKHQNDDAASPAALYAPAQLKNSCILDVEKP